MSERWGKIHFCADLRRLQPRLLPDALPGDARACRGASTTTPNTRTSRHLQPMNQFMTIALFVLGAAQIILVAQLLPLHAPWSRLRGPTPGGPTRWSGRRRPPRPTRTSPGFPSSTAGRTSTAPRRERTITGPRTSRRRVSPARRCRPTAIRRGRMPDEPRSLVGLHRFAVLTAGATLLLIAAGGLVTSTESGLSVPDWPTTYGRNMFTFPPSQWVGGIRFEHGHRLIASFVGLLTVILAIWLARREPRRWVRPARLGGPGGRDRAGDPGRHHRSLPAADPGVRRPRLPRPDVLLPDRRDRRRDLARLARGTRRSSTPRCGGRRRPPSP